MVGKRCLCLLHSVVHMKKKNSKKLQLKFKKKVELNMKQTSVIRHMKIHYIILATSMCILSFPCTRGAYRRKWV